MGYSPSAMAGVKANGKNWKATISGVPEILKSIRENLDKETPAAAEAISAELKKIAAKFRPHFSDTKGNYTSGELDALEWFEDESPTYEFEQGTAHEWREELDYRMGELYDFADYNRIWVTPH